MFAGSKLPFVKPGNPLIIVGCTANPRKEKYPAPSPPRPVEAHNGFNPGAFFNASSRFVTTCSFKSSLVMVV
ncbi:hypothetical protein D3C87_987880 [compost metagenome]